MTHGPSRPSRSCAHSSASHLPGLAVRRLAAFGSSEYIFRSSGGGAAFTAATSTADGSSGTALPTATVRPIAELAITSSGPLIRPRSSLVQSVSISMRSRSRSLSRLMKNDLAGDGRFPRGLRTHCCSVRYAGARDTVGRTGGALAGVSGRGVAAYQANCLPIGAAVVDSRGDIVGRGRQSHLRDKCTAA